MSVNILITRLPIGLTRAKSCILHVHKDKFNFLTCPNPWGLSNEGALSCYCWCLSWNAYMLCSLCFCVWSENWSSTILINELLRIPQFLVSASQMWRNTNCSHLVFNNSELNIFGVSVDHIRHLFFISSKHLRLQLPWLQKLFSSVSRLVRKAVYLLTHSVHVSFSAD